MQSVFECLLCVQIKISILYQTIAFSNVDTANRKYILLDNGLPNDIGLCFVLSILSP